MTWGVVGSGGLWELHEVMHEDHSKWHLAYGKRYERVLCRSQGSPDCAPCYSPPGRPSSSQGMLVRATLTEKLQEAAHILRMDEEDPGAIVGRPAGARHTSSAGCLLRAGPQAGGFTFPSTPDMADKDASASGLGTSLT